MGLEKWERRVNRRSPKSAHDNEADGTVQRGDVPTIVAIGEEASLAASSTADGAPVRCARPEDVERVVDARPDLLLMDTTIGATQMASIAARVRGAHSCRCVLVAPEATGGIVALADAAGVDAVVLAPVGSAVLQRFVALPPIPSSSDAQGASPRLPSAIIRIE